MWSVENAECGKYMVTGHSQIPQACRMNVITYQHVVLKRLTTVWL